MITTDNITQLLAWLKQSGHLNNTPQADVFADYQYQPFAVADMTKARFGRLLTSQGMQRRSARNAAGGIIKVWALLPGRNDAMSYQAPKPKKVPCPVCDGSGSVRPDMSSDLIELVKEIYPDRYTNV